MARILVVGATGLIGLPVARRLLADGHHVRLLVRDTGRARQRLGEGFEYVEGSVTDTEAIDRAVQGMNGVHVSLGVEDPAQLETVEHQGTAAIAAAAGRHGLERISYLTGSLVRADYGPKIPEHQAKLAAEQAIEGSGVPYTFFRPTYFTNTLHRHVQGCLAWDWQSVDVLSARQIKLARAVGALTEVAAGLSARAYLHLLKGEFSEASSLAAEAQSVREATNSAMVPYPTLALAAFQGREAETAALIEAGRKDAERRGEGKALTFFQWATAVLYNSLGRYDDALAAAQQASDYPPVQFYVSWSLVELVEAAARSSSPGCATGALSRLSELTSTCGTDWALGIEARSRALLSRGIAAERQYCQAIERLGRTPLKLELARAQLLYGEWLRRERRRRDAREQLRAAYECFDSMGATAFADRARGELGATGERAPKRTSEARETLTSQEALIARRAGGGASNRQIAEELFISPATVAYHLRKVFTKLGVNSRRELATAVPLQRSPLPSVVSPAQTSP